MAGRGGRGAALLQALEKPNRPPGQAAQNGQGGRPQAPYHQNPYQQQSHSYPGQPGQPYQAQGQSPYQQNQPPYNAPPQQPYQGQRQPQYQPQGQASNQQPPQQGQRPYQPSYQGQPSQQQQQYQGQTPYQQQPPLQRGPYLPQQYQQPPGGRGAPQQPYQQQPSQGRRGQLQQPYAQSPYQQPPQQQQQSRGPYQQTAQHPNQQGGRGQAPPPSYGRGGPTTTVQQQPPPTGEAPAHMGGAPSYGRQSPAGSSQESVRSQPSPTSSQQPEPQAPTQQMSRMNIRGSPPIAQTRTAEKGSAGKVIPLSCNYIRIHCPEQAVFQYCVSYSPEIDNRSERFHLLQQHPGFRGPQKAFDSTMLFLPRRLPQPVTQLQSTRRSDGSPVTVTITFTRVVPPDDAIFQVYNILFRRVMKILDMQQVGRYFYNPKTPAHIPQHNLVLWPGYITSLQHYEGGLMLLCDVHHRLLRTDSCLDYMLNMHSKVGDRFRDEVSKELIGSVVLTTYNNKTYRVDDIDWNKRPTSTFIFHNGEQMTFVEYYKKSYEIEIRDLDQPMIVNRPKKTEQKRGGRPQVEVILLIPELCKLTGLNDAMRKDFRVMKDIAAHTRVNPMQRQEAMKKFVMSINSTPEALEQLTAWNLRLDTSTLMTEGRQFPPEKIIYGNTTGSAGDQADWGRDATREKVISAVNLNNWMVFFTQRDSGKANDFVQTMNKCAPAMGIQVNQPKMNQLRDDRTETYLRSIRENLHPQVQVVVVIFPTSRDDRYAAVKKLCCVESPVPSQVIISKTISNPTKLRSVVQKIALQINVKLGGELWALDIPSRSLMVCGIDVYHDKARGGRSVGGLVCSMNRSLTRWYSDVCFQSPGQELIDGLKMLLIKGIRKWHDVNNALPERIIVYRDGVGDGQLKVVAGYEVQQFEECFASFGESYKPKLAVLVVQKRINTRIFSAEGRGPQPRLGNPGPGSVLDHTVTRKDWNDFFLVSQHVRQGTVTPTHYVVVYDTSNWKPDIMQKLSYKLTHLYYNWPGTVRVPAPCQYAHKLAYQVGQSIHGQPSQELCDRLFFL
uniref:Piwi2 n=1 Tax=Nematostella vectensis TaxID=45351 RepID=A0A286RTI8_NEMVE|nr:piwi2 [Nematostella vectensis]